MVGQAQEKDLAAHIHSHPMGVLGEIGIIRGVTRSRTGHGRTGLLVGRRQVAH